jgi:hypothetical protein
VALTDTAIRLARPRERAYKLSDGLGLCLLVQPNGSKWWRYRYRFGGVPKMLSMGIYPDVPLSEARERRHAARRQLAAGANPSAQRKAENAANQHTFESVARHWLAQQARYIRKRKRSLSTYKKAKWMLQSFIFPELGDRSIGTTRNASRANWFGSWVTRNGANLVSSTNRGNAEPSARRTELRLFLVLVVLTRQQVCDALVAVNAGLALGLGLEMILLRARALLGAVHRFERVAVAAFTRI